jgi:Putative transposase
LARYRPFGWPQTQDLRLHPHAYALMACVRARHCWPPRATLSHDPTAEPSTPEAHEHTARDTWVVYAKARFGPAAVLNYLSRHTHRTAVGHERIVAVREDGVRLDVRAGGPGARKLLRIDSAEFVGRFLQHVLPPRFKRIHHYGRAGEAGRVQDVSLRGSWRCRRPA